MVVVAATAIVAGAAPATANPGPVREATIVLTSSGVSVEEMAASGMAVGYMSAGHGVRPPLQTFIDITQGARVSDSLYDGELPERVRFEPGGVRASGWARIEERAESAPADLAPGLLAQTIGGGVASPTAGDGRLIAANRAGRFATGPAALSVIGSRAADLDGVVAEAGPERIVIALAMPRVRGQRLVAIGIAGAGYDGILRSPTTRLDGLISAIDIAPTLIEALGREVPEEIDGRVISSDTDGSAAEVADLGDRLLELSPRRTPVVWMNVGIWVVLAALVSAGLGRAWRELALPWLAVTMAALPATLLLGAALEPSELAERLIVGLGAPALAWLLLRRVERYGAFAIAAAISVGAYAFDVIAGSPLTALTVGGSNPSSGVRYFGIGNEHEAALSALTLTGAGAAIAHWRERISPRAAAIGFAVVAAAAVLAFAPGKFGADVGMAITIPAGAAVALAVMLEVGRRGWILVLLAPVAGLAALVGIDLASGGDAHFSRTVLDAEDSGDVADVFESRLRLAWGSVERNAESPFLWAALTVLVALAYYWRSVWRALSSAPRPARAGLAGAAAATAAGTLANDSGITLFVIGIWFVIPFAGLIWVAGAEER